jgi:hypothetical protein
MTSEAILSTATLVVTVASILANILPNESDKKFLSAIIHTVRFLAFNIDVKGLKR